MPEGTLEELPCKPLITHDWAQAETLETWPLEARNVPPSDRGRTSGSFCFYGTTTIYGTSRPTGTIFKITPQGTLTTPHRFCREVTSCLDGASPTGLLLVADGNFYGITALGGITSSPNCLGDQGVGGCGTIFKATPGGAVTTLHRFAWTDGGYPAAGLVQAADGNLYGTTHAGRGLRSGYGVPNGSKWQADDALQLLCPNEVR